MRALHSFVPFVDGRHRCGVFPFSFGLIPGDIREMHYNHRYCFNTDLLPALDRSGVSVSAQTDDIVEAISQPELPFWHGVQGHPELMSRPDAPHPLFVAFYGRRLTRQRNAATAVAGKRRHDVSQLRQRRVVDRF
ncbi:hypothetical protein LNO36_11410 [Klebsiella variicola subsp. variicola]|nr:hypothetical protein [Klebsiella variicola subsp. variicola]